jgi:hypothetical protein
MNDLPATAGSLLGKRQLQSHCITEFLLFSYLQEAGLKIFISLGICLLSIIALLLADAALIVWIFNGRGYR